MEEEDVVFISIINSRGVQINVPYMGSKRDLGEIMDIVSQDLYRNTTDPELRIGCFSFKKEKIDGYTVYVETKEDRVAAKQRDTREQE